MTEPQKQDTLQLITTIRQATNNKLDSKETTDIINIIHRERRNGVPFAWKTAWDHDRPTALERLLKNDPTMTVRDANFASLQLIGLCVVLAFVIMAATGSL